MTARRGRPAWPRSRPRAAPGPPPRRARGRPRRTGAPRRSPAAARRAGARPSGTRRGSGGEGVGLLEKRVGMHPAWANAGGGLPVGAGIPREHPMTTRVSAAGRTRERLEALIDGRLATAPERSDLVRLAARLILEEAL